MGTIKFYGTGEIERLRCRNCNCIWNLLKCVRSLSLSLTFELVTIICAIHQFALKLVVLYSRLKTTCSLTWNCTTNRVVKPQVKCGEITAGGKLNVPLDAVYSAPYELFFKPKEGVGFAYFLN